MRSNRRTASRIATLIIAGAVMAALLAATPVTASDKDVGTRDAARPEAPAADAEVVRGAEVFGPFTPTLSPAAADVGTAVSWQPGDPAVEQPRLTHEVAPPGDPANPTTWTIDPLLELQAGVSRDPDRALSTPAHNFAGQGYTGSNPPDTVGDVGPTHYIQAVNSPAGSNITIYNKATEAIVLGPFALDSLGGTAACQDGHGDPIILYDPLADRWLLSEFSDIGNHLCVYVSQTANPTGAYHAYDFSTPNFPDYPKYAVWPDAFFVTTNEGGVPAVYAMERSDMLAGNPATLQRFTASSLAGFGFQALTPADLDGPAPPAGAPGYFARHRDDEVHNAGANNPTQDYLDLFELSVDWVTPGNSTFTGPVSVPVTEFDSHLCGLVSFNCFPQPGTGVTLDPLREVVMWRLVYRNFGPHQKLVGNFVTDVDGTDRGGVRWFELRRTGVTPWGLYQEGTYAPDADNRWMGAIAVDQNGNLALGYNVVSSTQNPDLRYVGRLATDPLGTMPDGEYTLVAGSGYNASNRWGDYSAMSVDPVDGCTFWFTGMTALASHQWATRIGAFKFDSCAPPAPGIVFDGGFEAGTPNPFWNEASTNFGTPLCTVPSCGSGGSSQPAHGGLWWAWFGGISGSETGSVDQDVTIPAGGTATLTFYLEIPDANTTSFLDVKMDGATLLGVTDADMATYPTYQLVTIDVSAYADGGTHNLLFFSTKDPGGNTNFFVDDVSITFVPDTTAPTVTLSTPANGGSYARGTSVLAAYSCADGESGVASCVGTVANGAAIDTATLGAKSFTVTGTDNVGNVNAVTHNYTVVDVTAPTVAVTTPANGASYTQGTSVPAAFSCADEAGGSGVASCVGTVASGAGIDTATPGPKAFTVTGTDNAGNVRVVTHNYTVLPNDTVGLVDITTGVWRLRNSAGVVTQFFYGNPVDLPISGDWDGNGTSTPGLYRQSDGFFYARDTNDQGPADNSCFAGDPSDVPVVGDWDGDGDDNLGIYRPSEQKFYLFTITCTGSPMGAAQIVLTFGNPGDKPVAGDWDGDGIDEVGLHRESTGFFYWRNTLDTGIASGEIFFGDPNDRFVSGDWGIVDGVDTPAIFRPGDLTFYFRHTLTEGVADSQFLFPGAEATWLPVSGPFGLG